MGEVIRFISKSERERARLSREARVTYDSIFPPVDPASEQLDMAPSGANAHRSDGGSSVVIEIIAVICACIRFLKEQTRSCVS